MDPVGWVVVWLVHVGLRMHSSRIYLRHEKYLNMEEVIWKQHTGFPALPVTPVTVSPTPRPAAPTTPPTVLVTPPTPFPNVEVTNVRGLFLSSPGMFVCDGARLFRVSTCVRSASALF